MPRARDRRRRSVAPTSAGFLLKGLIGGAALVTGGVVAVTALMAGLGWLLATSRDARADIRSDAFATSRPGWTALPAGDAGAPPAPMAWPEYRFPDLPVRDPVGGLALMTRQGSAADDAMVTGSLGAPASNETSARKQPSAPKQASSPEQLSSPKAPPPPKPAPAPKLASIDPAAVVIPVPDKTPPAAAPKPKPRVAALTPFDGLPSRLQEDARGRRTAIYDISAGTVYMPNGERLEAHSGIGSNMDDPRSMRTKMRGVTPPNTYDLKLRESLFHGVQALRLKPIYQAEMFGRDGMLAHSYLLGPSGQSHGCVAFKNYPKFLRAYMRGEVDRLIVVPRLAKPPVYAAQTRAG